MKNNIGKIIFTFMAIFALFLFISPVMSAQMSTGPNIKVAVLKYDPAPAEAGKFIELWLSIENKGTGVVNDYVTELIPGYPFFLDSNENSVRNFAFIDTDGVRTKYKLRVAEDAPNGDAVLKIKHYAKGSSLFTTDDLEISILGKVDMDIVSVEPDTLTPGSPTKVKFLFNNSGSAPVKDLVVMWNDPNKQILPLAGENRYRIQELDIGKSTEVEFNMIADPSITQGVHVINLNMTFQRFGTADSRTSQIAFIVGGMTNFDVAQQDIEGNAVSLSVANIGVNTATGVLISVSEQSGWKIVGGSSVFLGNLNPGDFTVASFQLQSLSKDINKLSAKIEYTDTTGIRRSAEKDISINLAQATTQKTKESPNFFLYFVVIVIAIAAGWYVRKRFRKRQPK
ncbi:MAG: hypothetical protein V1802_00840 [Candidatus Aenigmatarchaeota archaeon]